ncbi:hypothetical protein N9O03_00390 [Candidatus Pelagibacter sp.]|nr:hypothetical protein [Candidatus Pelagibacter sp.]
MQFSKNTSNGSGKNLIIKIVLVLIIFIGAIVLLGKIEFPHPNKDIEKIIPNEKLKIVK